MQVVARILLKTSIPLRDELKQMALEQKRSMNKQLELILQEAVRAWKKEKIK